MQITAETKYYSGVIYNALQKLGWTQAELARRAGVANAVISDIKLMKRKVSVTQANKVSNVLAEALNEHIDIMQDWPEDFKGTGKTLMYVQTQDVELKGLIEQTQNKQLMAPQEATMDSAMIQKAMKEVLDKREIHIFIERNNGCSFTDLSDEIGRSKNRVSQIYTAACSKMRAYLSYELHGPQEERSTATMGYFMAEIVNVSTATRIRYEKKPLYLLSKDLSIFRRCAKKTIGGKVIPLIKHEGLKALLKDKARIFGTSFLLNRQCVFVLLSADDAGLKHDVLYIFPAKRVTDWDDCCAPYYTPATANQAKKDARDRASRHKKAVVLWDRRKRKQERMLRRAEKKQKQAVATEARLRRAEKRETEKRLSEEMWERREEGRIKLDARMRNAAAVRHVRNTFIVPDVPVKIPVRLAMSLSVYFGRSYSYTQSGITSLVSYDNIARITGLDPDVLRDRFTVSYSAYTGSSFLDDSSLVLCFIKKDNRIHVVHGDRMSDDEWFHFLTEHDKPGVSLS